MRAAERPKFFVVVVVCLHLTLVESNRNDVDDGLYIASLMLSSTTSPRTPNCILLSFCRFGNSNCVFGALGQPTNASLICQFCSLSWSAP